jgi:hypothetical protein
VVRILLASCGKARYEQSQAIIIQDDEDGYYVATIGSVLLLLLQWAASLLRGLV